MTAFARAAFTTTMRVVDRVHHHTTHGRANAHPALDAGLAKTAQAMLFIGDFADRGAALDVDLAHFTRAQTHLGINAFTGQQRS